VWEVARREIHPFDEVHRDDVGDEFGHITEVSELWPEVGDGMTG
jgi:hypothetical protein